jgi:hypothetical protein
MNPTFPVAAPADAPARADTRARRRAVLVALLAGYLCINLLSRWLSFPLWTADNAHGWEVPTFAETAYHVYMACLPVAVWALLVYLAAACCPRLLGCAAITVGAWLCLLFVELDVGYYQQSQQHIGWEDVQGAFEINWERDLGLRDADYQLFAVVATLHALACTGIYVVAWALVHYRSRRLAETGLRRRIARVRLRHVILILAGLVAADCCILQCFGEPENAKDGSSRWRELAQSNPFRLHFLDDVVDMVAYQFTDKRTDLQAANDFLAELEPPPRTESEPYRDGLVPPQPRRPYNVVIIAVESLNADAVRTTRLPFLTRFARRCLVLENHYSTGNCTQYGVLGLLYGTPVGFYQGHLQSAGIRSPYLDLFARRGYRTRTLAIELMDHCFMGDYLSNFTAPTFEAKKDWDVIPAFRREVARAGPRLTFLFYDGTHLPYRHAPAYHAYVPEVPEDVNLYSSWSLHRHRDAIRNRYRNCLLEFDDWLRYVIAEIDLDNTIVIVTGDHGEDLLGNGRLGHSNGFSVGQTRPPCWIHIPGMPARTIKSLTSHADLMPSVVDALGWEPPPGRGLGRSIFRAGPGRTAVIAHQHWEHRPKRWAVVTEDGKALLEGDTAAGLQITGLSDAAGQPAKFRPDPERWRDSFQAIKQFQATLP